MTDHPPRDEVSATVQALKGAATLLEGAIKERQVLASEIHDAEQALAAVLQERLDAEAALARTKAQLERAGRGIQEVRAEQSDLVLEFDEFVQLATARRAAVVAEIAALERRRDTLAQLSPPSPPVRPIQSPPPATAAPDVNSPSPAAASPAPASASPMPAAPSPAPAAPSPMSDPASLAPSAAGPAPVAAASPVSAGVSPVSDAAASLVSDPASPAPSPSPSAAAPPVPLPAASPAAASEVLAGPGAAPLAATPELVSPHRTLAISDRETREGERANAPAVSSVQPLEPLEPLEPLQPAGQAKPTAASEPVDGTAPTAVSSADIQAPPTTPQLSAAAAVAPGQLSAATLAALLAELLRVQSTLATGLAQTPTVGTPEPSAAPAPAAEAAPPTTPAAELASLTTPAGELAPAPAPAGELASSTAPAGDPRDAPLSPPAAGWHSDTVPSSAADARPVSPLTLSPTATPVTTAAPRSPTPPNTPAAVLQSLLTPPPASTEQLAAQRGQTPPAAGPAISQATSGESPARPPVRPPAGAPGRPETPASRRRRRLQQAATAVMGTILFGLVLLLTPVSQVFGGLQLLAVMSGSMEPTIHVGGIVGIRPVPATDLQLGDIITFANQSTPDLLVTHRIVNLESRNGQVLVTTKGDANDSADALAAAASRTVGRVEFTLPWLGFLMVWLGSPLAKIVILVLSVITFALPSFKRTPAAAAATTSAGGDTATRVLTAAPAAVTSGAARATPASLLVGVSQRSADTEAQVARESVAATSVVPAFEVSADLAPDVPAMAALGPVAASAEPAPALSPSYAALEREIQALLRNAR